MLNVPKRLSATIVVHRSAAQYGQYSAPTYWINGSDFPLTVLTSAGCPLSGDGAVIGATGEVTPTVLNTDAGTEDNWLMVVASTASKVVDAFAAGEPLVILMTTRPITITRTTPTAIQVKRPAGRPPFAGDWAFLLAGDFATMLLIAV